MTDAHVEVSLGEARVKDQFENEGTDHPVKLAFVYVIKDQTGSPAQTLDLAYLSHL